MSRPLFKGTAPSFTLPVTSGTTGQVIESAGDGTCVWGSGGASPVVTAAQEPTPASNVTCNARKGVILVKAILTGIASETAIVFTVDNTEFDPSAHFVTAVCNFNGKSNVPTEGVLVVSINQVSVGSFAVAMQNAGPTTFTTANDGDVQILFELHDKA